MKIGIITYDKYHLKTHQLLIIYYIRKLFNNFKSFKKKSLFRHRPDQFNFLYCHILKMKTIKLKNLSNIILIIF